MKIKVAKKIGLFASISVLIGSIIGIGIFFKNNSVFEDNNNNAWGVLISWILASVISLLTAYSFAEVGFNHKNGAGLSGSCERMFGYKFGRFIAFNNSFFYFGIISIALSVFSAEALIKIFVPDQSDLTLVMHVGYLMLISLGILILFLLFNYFAITWSRRFQIATTILKFIPLIMVAIAGIVHGARNFNGSLFDPSGTNSNNAGTINVQGILSSIPAILFAYDSFLGVASLQGEMDNPRKKVPIAIVLGMGICIVGYIAITIGQIMVSQWTAANVFNTIFANNPQLKAAFTIIINVFIFVSAIGCLNAFVLVSLRTATFAVKYRIFYGYWWLEKYSSQNIKSGLALTCIIFFFWWLVLLVPSVILNTDAIVDGASNFPTLFMFVIYGTVILKTWTNRFTKKVAVTSIPGFVVVAPLATLGCYLAFGYQFFYHFSVKVILERIVSNSSLQYNWGLYFNSGIDALFAMIIFFIMLAIFILLPFVNDLAIKGHYNRNDSPQFIRQELLL